MIVKDIVGYEGLYIADELGNITRIAVGQGTRCSVLKPDFSGGYARVNLRRDGRSKTHLVHRLVCEAFHGTFQNMQVNHINGDKSDNSPENLEWCTSSENNLHKSQVLGKNLGSTHYAYGKVGATSKDAVEYILDNGIDEPLVVKGIADFCRSNNLHHSAMIKVAQGKQRLHKGWKCTYNQQVI